MMIFEASTAIDNGFWDFNGYRRWFLVLRRLQVMFLGASVVTDNGFGASMVTNDGFGNTYPFLSLLLPPMRYILLCSVNVTCFFTLSSVGRDMIDFSSF